MSKMYKFSDLSDGTKELIVIHGIIIFLLSLTATIQILGFGFDALAIKLIWWIIIFIIITAVFIIISALSGTLWKDDQENLNK